MTAPDAGNDGRYGGRPDHVPARRSIFAQIDEIEAQLERCRRDMQRMRGRDESEAREHVLRLECVLRTLKWVRDHRDDIRAFVARNPAARKGPVT